MTEPPEDEPASVGDRWDGLKLRLFIFIGFPLLLICLPVLLPLAAGLEKRRKKRLRAAAIATRCTRCGSCLGIAALELSDADWNSFLARVPSSGLRIRPRVVRRVHARCPQCGAEYAFDEKAGLLRLRNVGTEGSAA